jgi:arylsulfatase A-like enzyme
MAQTRYNDAATLLNILILLTEDQRWKMLGIMGNPVIQTPNIDRFRKNGIVSDHACASTSICSVSRASIPSMEYGQRHGYGNMTEYCFWQMGDYFCEHLLGSSEKSVDIKQMNNAKQQKK